MFEYVRDTSANQLGLWLGEARNLLDALVSSEAFLIFLLFSRRRNEHMLFLSENQPSQASLLRNGVVRVGAKKTCFFVLII